MSKKFYNIRTVTEGRSIPRALYGYEWRINSKRSVNMKFSSHIQSSSRYIFHVESLRHLLIYTNRICDAARNLQLYRNWKVFFFTVLFAVFLNQHGVRWNRIPEITLPIRSPTAVCLRHHIVNTFSISLTVLELQRPRAENRGFWTPNMIRYKTRPPKNLAVHLTRHMTYWSCKIGGGVRAGGGVAPRNKLGKNRQVRLHVSPTRWANPPPGRFLHISAWWVSRRRNQFAKFLCRCLWRVSDLRGEGAGGSIFGLSPHAGKASRRYNCRCYH